MSKVGGPERPAPLQSYLSHQPEKESRPKTSPSSSTESTVKARRASEQLAQEKIGEDQIAGSVREAQVRSSASLPESDKPTNYQHEVDLDGASTYDPGHESTFAEPMLGTAEEFTEREVGTEQRDANFGTVEGGAVSGRFAASAKDQYGLVDLQSDNGSESIDVNPSTPEEFYKYETEHLRPREETNKKLSSNIEDYIDPAQRPVIFGEATWDQEEQTVSNPWKEMRPTLRRKRTKKGPSSKES